MPPELNPDHGTPPHLLIVAPNEPDYQAVVWPLLQAPVPGYRLTWSTSVREAMSQGRRAEFQMILLADCFATDPNHNYLHLARRHQLKIPVIVFGQSIKSSHEERFIEDGAIDVLELTNINLNVLRRAFRYIARLQQQQHQIQTLRLYDDLTGAPSRLSFTEQLGHAFEHANRSATKLGLMMLNIDGFKRVHNALGPEIGDETISKVASRLQAGLESGQELARVGDNQFALLLAGEQDLQAQLNKLIDRICYLQQRPYRVQGHNLALGISIGCAIYPDSSKDMASLVRHAGSALHLAKKERGCTFRFYEERNFEDAVNQITLEPELLNALRQEQFVLHYQPRIDIHTQRIVGVEALIRWQHPEKGLLFPDTFIPMAEKSGLIVPMGYWVFNKALEDMKLLDAQGCELNRIGINLSFRQFQDDTLVPTIARLLSRSGIHAGRVEFELTETAVALNEQHVSQCIADLSTLGVTFSLDDFGTGYSSFAHLQKLPINTLKIDKAFVQGVTDNPDDAEIVRAIINLAHNLRKDVVAEGAETAEQINFLKRNECDQVQGYFYSKPVALPLLFKQLKQQRQKLAGAETEAETEKDNISNA
ncbi:bifunctional diguanylate cyclase/phosphodiesterase [Motiliproteus coralliicola]|uniref:Bifunctional diguanylate cyclase/phosphodiesterase n=1 Tax=Motiliproteus coralliicola TaxID=2283196 RepID=A0A369WEQ5_9GAMM|nr:bifunctional diguanylate cyclase/phosphodiesterase [Motiliproteus coralliicola]RDE19096.1 bifunctional diguanylate cyclase/phosphodiesterase [Motiliproteus coralliicola]